MTTSQERLQELFDAALKDTSDLNHPPTRVSYRTQAAQAAQAASVGPVEPAVKQADESGGGGAPLE